MRLLNSLLLIIIFMFSCYTSGQEKTKVLLLGTYHFGGTSDNNKVYDDVLNPKKQKELEILLKQLKDYAPEKIYVENIPTRQQYWDSIFDIYHTDKTLKIKNEIFQIGIKLAELLRLRSGITCVDWQQDSESYFNEKAYVEYKNKINAHQDSLETLKPSIESEISKKITAKIQSIYSDIPKLPIIDALLKLNSKSFQNDIYYGNVISFLDIDSNNNGVFYTHENMIRNTNIYKNIIQDIFINKPKRVLVIYGAGHIKALKNYFEAHPNIEVIEVDKYLK